MAHPSVSTYFSTTLMTLLCKSFLPRPNPDAVPDFTCCGLAFIRHGLSSSPRTVTVRVVSTVRIIAGLAMPVGLLAPKSFLVVVVVEDVDVVDLLTIDVASFFTTFFSGVELMMVVTLLDTELVDLAGVNSAVLRPVVTGVVGLADGRFNDPLTSGFSAWISCSN